MSQAPRDVHQLKKSYRYRVRRDFTDFHRNTFREGEVLTFRELHFLPYHGGYTLVFEERQLYLQEEENTDILESFSEYMSQIRE